MLKHSEYLQEPNSKRSCAGSSVSQNLCVHRIHLILHTLICHVCPGHAHHWHWRFDVFQLVLWGAVCAFYFEETASCWLTCRQANKTGPVANPSLRSAAVGFPRWSAHDVKSSTSSISWKKWSYRLFKISFSKIIAKYRIILVKDKICRKD